MKKRKRITKEEQEKRRLEEQERENANKRLRMEASAPISTDVIASPVEAVASSSEDSQRTGMAEKHTKIMKEFSNENDVIIIWRPINVETASRLEQGSIGKALYTKAKSSNFGPIAGDIPYDTRLSKLAESEEDKVKIPYFQKMNEDSLKTSEEKYKLWKGKINKENAADFNDLYLMTAVPKKDEQGRDIYFIVGEDGNIVTASDNIPHFVIRDEKSGYHFYNKITGEFDTEPGTLPEGAKVELVKIMAYHYYASNKGEIIRPITADYDELVSAARKIYPLNNNIELQTTYTVRSEDIILDTGSLLERLNDKIINNEMITKEDIILSSSDIDELNILPVLEYERKLKRHHRDTAEQQAMGYVNDWQRDVKTYLKEETEGATSHGPEVNNPFPEDITKDVTYVAFIPEDKGIEYIHGEQALCDFINKLRRQGFPLDVNPKWGWEIDERGQLYISTEETRWNNVLGEISSLKETLYSLETEHANKMKNMGLQPTESNIENLSILKKTEEQLDLLREGQLSSSIYDETDLLRLRTLLLNALELMVDKNNFTVPSHEVIDNLAQGQKDIVNLRRHYLAVIDLMNKLEKVKRLELEPDIVYGDVMNPKNERYIETGIEEILISVYKLERSTQEYLQDRLEEYKQRNLDLYDKVSKQVTKQQSSRDKIIPIISQREKQERQEKIKKLNLELDQLLDNFSRTFIGETTNVSALRTALEMYKIKLNAQYAEVLPLESGEAAQSSSRERYGIHNKNRMFQPASVIPGGRVTPPTRELASEEVEIKPSEEKGKQL